jgi:hypothetical protein
LWEEFKEILKLFVELSYTNKYVFYQKQNRKVKQVLSGGWYSGGVGGGGRI